MLCAIVDPDAWAIAIDDRGLDSSLINAENDNLGIRSVAGIWSRFLMPVMVLWLYGLAVGKGFTAALFSKSIFVNTLAPVSYNLYLFHQWVGQMYFLITRQQWWSYWRYRKPFFWFSPQPVPVAWWEYFFVVILTTFFSMLMAKLDPYLISKWEAGRTRLKSLCFKHTGGDRVLTPIEVVLSVVEQLTGAGPPLLRKHLIRSMLLCATPTSDEWPCDRSQGHAPPSRPPHALPHPPTPTAVEADWTLAECGLASVAGPVVVSRLQAAVPGVTISVANLIEVDDAPPHPTVYFCTSLLPRPVPLTPPPL